MITDLRQKTCPPPHAHIHTHWDLVVTVRLCCTRGEVPWNTAGVKQVFRPDCRPHCVPGSPCLFFGVTTQVSTALRDASNRPCLLSALGNVITFKSASPPLPTLHSLSPITATTSPTLPRTTTFTAAYTRCTGTSFPTHRFQLVMKKNSFYLSSFFFKAS